MKTWQKIWLILLFLAFIGWIFVDVMFSLRDNTVPQSEDTVLFNQLRETFTWNIVDWTNLEIVDITWDYTLYYNDEFGIATVLWEEWKWYTVRVDMIEDDFEYSWEVIKIPRSMIWIWKFMAEWEPDFYSDDYGFSIISNEDTEKLRSDHVVWTTSLYEETYKWRNNKYSFFEASARNWSQRYLLENFPNLDCRTWTGWIEYDIDWNPHEYIDADCNWYEVIDWKAVKTRKSWIEQLFPIWFLFYDIN